MDDFDPAEALVQSCPDTPHIYDLAFISVELETFFVLCYGAILLHLLCSIYMRRKDQSCPTTFESILFLTSAWTLWLPISKALCGFVDAIMFHWCQQSTSSEQELMKTYAFYQLKQSILWEIINNYTLRIGGPWNSITGVFPNVGLTWIVFELVFGLENVWNVILDIRDGKKCVRDVMAAYGRRLRAFWYSARFSLTQDGYHGEGDIFLAPSKSYYNDEKRAFDV